MKTISCKGRDFIAESFNAFKKKEVLEQAEFRCKQAESRRKHKVTVAATQKSIKALINMIGHDSYQLLINQNPVTLVMSERGIVTESKILGEIKIGRFVSIILNHNHTYFQSLGCNHYDDFVTLDSVRVRFEQTLITKPTYLLVSSREELQEKIGALIQRDRAFQTAFLTIND